MRELTQVKAEAVLKECNTTKEDAVGKDQCASKEDKVARTKNGSNILVRDTIDISRRNTNSQSQSTTGKELARTLCLPEQRQEAQPPVSPGPTVGTASLMAPATVAPVSLGGMAVRPPRSQPVGQPLQTNTQASFRHAEPQQGIVSASARAARWPRLPRRSLRDSFSTRSFLSFLSVVSARFQIPPLHLHSTHYSESECSHRS